MPVLKNPKYEAFALAWARGGSQIDAYVQAGFKHEKKNAARLARRPEVFARYEELRADLLKTEAKVVERVTEKLADEIVVTRQWVLDKLVENVERAMQARAVLGPEGEPTGEYKYDGAVANRALELLGKELGMFIERRENLNVNYSISDEPLSADAWAQKHTIEHEPKKH
jgi:phage terminase small subunit